MSNSNSEAIDISNIYNYLNNTKLNLRLSQEVFDDILPQLVENIYAYGFNAIIENYNNSLTDINKDWTNLKNKKIENNYISSTSTVGLPIIKRYMPHIYEVKNFKGTNVSGLWNIENIKTALLINRKTHSTPYVSEIIRQLGFMAGTSKVTIYRPLLTKRIIEYYNPNSVLDVCVGWGGRMLGTACKPNVKYTGIEPFTKTFNGLKSIKDKLNLDNVTLYNDTAENVLPTLTEKYDLALTSPPYWNLEIYSDEETQSHHYGNYDEWYEHFLKCVVFGVIDKLNDNGKSCWSVKNFKTDKQYNLYDDIVKLHSEKGWKKIDDEFYVGNCVRPGVKNKGSNSAKGKEITYVFVKDSN